MQQLSIPRLVAKRLLEDWQLLAGTLIGMIVATTLASIAPLYIDSLEQLSFNNAIDRISKNGLRVDVFGPPLRLSSESVDGAENSVDEAFQVEAGDSYIGYETYIRSANYLVGLPSQALPAIPGTGEMVSRGFIHHLSNLEDHATFVSGRMSNTRPLGGGNSGSLGILSWFIGDVEAVISVATAERFALGPGDQVVLTPDLMMQNRFAVTITGIIEPDEPDSDYWSFGGIILDPSPLEELPPEGATLANPDEEEPPVALLVTRSAIVDVLGDKYTSSVVRPTWFGIIDSGRLTQWSIKEVLRRFENLEELIAETVPGSLVTTRSVLTPIRDIQRRAFFTRVPLLLLIALMAVTVLFFLATLVLYLVRSRERDTAVLRSRGVGLFELSRIYLLEGLTMAVVAVILGPILAIASVSAAGLLPYFRDITDRGMLPLVLNIMPFVLPVVTGICCLFIFVIAAVLGTKGGIIVERLQSSRPAALPFFHRYYLDAVVLLFGGIIFWELQSRGQLVSGGLFEDLEVNETLLLAPVLFLVVVGLIFMRFFPMVVRFVAGESDRIVHLGTSVFLLFIVGTSVWTERLGLLTVEHGWPVLAALLFGLVYVVTHRPRRSWIRLAGFILQVVVVIGIFFGKSLSVSDLMYSPFVSLVIIVVAQVAFLIFARLARTTPVWMSVALSHMARSPMQYTWVVLLLVLATGLALLSTTVGGTLERSQRERVLYDLASDIHVADIRSSRIGGLDGLQADIEDLPGVGMVTRAYRSAGNIGPIQFELLGLEPGEFPRLSWYRSDFSSRPMADVMGDLISSENSESLILPTGSETIDIWVKSEQDFRSLSLWAHVKDPTGWMTGLRLGKYIKQQDWTLMSADIPDRLNQPLELVAIHLSEPGQGNINTPGEIWIDDIQVTVEEGQSPIVLEGFEEIIAWLPISGSLLSGDAIQPDLEQSHTGLWSVKYTFGKESVRNIRGIYRLPTAGAVEAVISRSIEESAEISIGDIVMVQVSGLLVPVQINGVIENFPTINPDRLGFMLVDIEDILGHLNILGSSYSVSPNEFFVSKTDGQEDPLEDITQLVRFGGRVYGVDKEMEDILGDPLSGAGWKAMVLLSLVVVLIASAFTYAAYLLLFSRRSKGEIGFLESMGLSPFQLRAMLAFEHLTVVAIGIGLGTWAGFQMSQLMVGSLAVTEDGMKVMPPFILMTDWTLMMPTYVLMGTVFLVCLLALARSAGKLDLQALARLGET